MALIVGGKETLNPVIASVVEVDNGLYNLIEIESDFAYEDVVNRGTIEFQPGDKVLVLFDEEDQPYINDIGTARLGYNFIAISEVIPLQNKTAVPDNADIPEIIRTNADKVLVRGSTYRNTGSTVYPTISVNGTHKITLTSQQMALRTHEGMSTPYVDFAFEYDLNQGDRIYNMRISSNNGSLEANDEISLVKDTVGANIKSAALHYPGAQSVVKQGDNVNFVVVTDLAASAVTLQSEIFINEVHLARVEVSGQNATWTGLASINESINGSYTFTVTASDDLSNLTQKTSTQLQTAKIVVDQAGPSLHIVGVTYPANQYALKANEQCSIELVATDFSSIEYDSNNMEVLEPTTYESSKTVNAFTSTPNGDIPINVTARKKSNNSVAQAIVDVTVDNIVPTIAAIVFRQDAESTPLSTRVLSPGVYHITFITNTPLREAPIIEVTAGSLSAITGNDRSWTAYLTITPEDPDEGAFHNFTLRNRANVIGQTAIANIEFRTLNETPQVISFVAATKYGPIIVNGETVELTLTIDASGEHQNDNISVVVDASPLGGPADLELNTLMGQNKISGTFIAHVSGNLIGITCTGDIQDKTGVITTIDSAPVDLWATSSDYLNNREQLIKGVNRVGWLQLLAQPAHFTTTVYRDAHTVDLGRSNAINNPDAVVQFGCITVPENAESNTTYTFFSKKMQFNIPLSKSPFIYVDGWNGTIEDVYPEILDLSSYNLTLNDPQISVYVNGNGSNTWALVRDFSRDVPKRRLRTQIDLKAVNLYLDAAQIYDEIFFRIDLKTDDTGKAPRVANFGVCYYGLHE